VTLAERNPADRESLAQETRLPAASLQRLGGTLLDVLRGAAAAEPPAMTNAGRLEPAQERQVKQLLARLREIAASAQVSAPMLATRKDVEGLVRGRRDLPLLQGWRRALAGDELLGMLAPTGD